ncbi:hypothetical protein AOLI_G00183020 [Acnodon oligacanthus]
MNGCPSRSPQLIVIQPAIGRHCCGPLLQPALLSTSVNNHLNNKHRNAEGPCELARVTPHWTTLMTLSMGPTQRSANFFSLTSLGGSAEGQRGSERGDAGRCLVVEVKEQVKHSCYSWPSRLLTQTVAAVLVSCSLKKGREREKEGRRKRKKTPSDFKKNPLPSLHRPA